MEFFLWIYFIATAVLWCVFYIFAAKTMRSLPALPQLIPDNTKPLPKISVIVTAKDEAETIEKGLTSLIEQDYPNYEIIVVNDRSTDDTGRIIDRFAQTHAQIKPIHIEQLPVEWLGKVNALNQAVAHADGDWLLFTDADVHHNKTLWRRTIAYVEQHEYDHIALMPNAPTKGTLLQATIKAFALLFLFSTKVRHVHDPKHKAAIGIGAFNLVRHSAFKKTPGFEWLRLEVADDYALGLMMKLNGFRIGFATAYSDLAVEWYQSLGAMMRGLDKNIMAPGTQFLRFKLFFSPFIFSALLLAPFISLLFFSPPYFITGLVVFAVTGAVSFYATDPRFERPFNWLLSPLGFLIISYAFARACYLCLIRDGIVWRNTYYPRELLKKYQRYRL